MDLFCALTTTMRPLVATVLLSGIALGLPQSLQAAENPLKVLRQSIPSQSKRALRIDPESTKLKGWDYLATRMIDHGANPEQVAAMFTDRRMPTRKALYFSVRPRESKAMYRKHNTAANRKNALKFYQEHKQSFVQAEKYYRVPREVILAILQIETHCGRNTGSDSIFYRLARLAAAADPENIQANQKAYRLRDRSVSPLKVAERARWLESTFLPHTIATITLGDELRMDPFEIRGSSAGAIGLPQFLPGNVSLYGADANRDGKVDLFEPVDAIHSVARFLSSHGWRANTVTPAAKRKVIFHYNRSDSYVDTVLGMAGQLRQEMQK